MLTKILNLTASGLSAAADVIAKLADRLDTQEQPEEIQRPTDERIEKSCEEYAEAAERAREADKVKRQAKKTLGELKAGIYGHWRLTWKQSNRKVVDGDSVRRIFESHGLGPVPMRTVAPSLVLERV